jgi:ABC-type multidrug transport system fused ATPase/permease subunit
VVLMIGVSVLELVGIGSVFPLIAILVDPQRMRTLPVVSDIYAGLQPISPQAFLLLMCAVVAILVAAKVTATGFSYRWQFKFAYDVQRALSMRLLQTYLFAPYRFYLNKNTADLLKNIQSEIPALANGALIPSLQVMGETIVFVAVVGLLIVINPTLTAALIGAFGILIPVMLRFTRIRTERYAAQRRIAVGEMYRSASAALSGFKDLKVFGRQQDFIERYEDACERYCQSNAFIMLSAQIPRLVIELIVFVGFIGVLAYAAYWTGDARNALPLMGLYAIATARLMPSLSKIVAGIVQIRYYRGVLKFLPSMFASPGAESHVTLQSDVEAMPFEREIRVRDLTYRYPASERIALDGISLTISKGTTVALVGPSGSGKTTLADVILGLLDEYQGTIEIDGIALSKEAVASWQKHIGYVPQSVYLADDTLLRNIAFGVPDAQIDRAAAEHALVIAQLTETVASLPQGLDTVIGERGIRLSGGQRQRIGIARALYGDPDVLVLDEATSALDGLTEHEIAQEIALLAGSKTIIVIAHRLSTIKQCESIFLLEDGRITASGTYDQLVREGGFVARVAAHG